MNDFLGQSHPHHPEMSPSPEDLPHFFQGLNMSGQPSPLDNGIRHPNSHLNAHADIPPEFVGFTLTKGKKLGQPAGQPKKWAYRRRTEMKLSESDLQDIVRDEKKKGVSGQRRYLSGEFEGVKRDIVDDCIEEQNQLDPRFKYTLAALFIEKEQTSVRQRTIVSIMSINVILERHPVRTRERRSSFIEETGDLPGGQALPPHARSPHRPGHEHFARVIPPEHPEHVDHRLFGNLPGEPCVPVGPSEQPPPPPAHPHPHPHPHPQQPHPQQPYPQQAHPQQPHPQPHPQSHPHSQSPNQRFSDPFLYGMDAEDSRPSPESFGTSPEESMRNHPPNHQGREEFKATREHERKPKVASLPSDYDSLGSLSDDSGFSGARTHRTGDTEVSDHSSQEYPKRAKPQHRRRDSRRESPARGDRTRDRSRDGRRDSDYDHDGGLDRKDSLRRSRHRRDSDHKAPQAYRTHRRKSPARSPPSSREGSVRYADGYHEFIPSRTRERLSPSRRNSQESRPNPLPGRQFSNFSHPVEIHDDRTSKEWKHRFTQLENEKRWDQEEALRQEYEQRIWEQNTERMMRRDRDWERFDRRAYPGTRPGYPEVRYSQPRSQRFSRNMQSNGFPF